MFLVWKYFFLFIVVFNLAKMFIDVFSCCCCCCLVWKNIFIYLSMCLVVGKDLLVCLDCGGIFIGEFSLGKLMCLDWKK